MLFEVESSIKLVEMGDRNASYFHNFASQMWRINKIRGL